MVSAQVTRRMTCEPFRSRGGPCASQGTISAAYRRTPPRDFEHSDGQRRLVRSHSCAVPDLACTIPLPTGAEDASQLEAVPFPLARTSTLLGRADGAQ